MTRKEAAREAKRILGSAGVVDVVLRGFKPFKIGLQGPFAVDWRGQGDSWAEAFQAVRDAEEKQLYDRARAREARDRQIAARKAAEPVAVSFKGV
jgi:hypothetical protein